MRKLLLLSLLGMAAGCQSTPQVIENVHTGSKVYAGGVTNAAPGLTSNLNVRPFYSVQTGYGFNTSYSNYGWLFISEAWSFGKRLNYEKRDSNVTMCAGAGGCITVENGVVHLSEAEFRKAAESGFAFQLRGSSGEVTGKIPAAKFRDVLNLKNRS